MPSILRTLLLGLPEPQRQVDKVSRISSNFAFHPDLICQPYASTATAREGRHSDSLRLPAADGDAPVWGLGGERKTLGVVHRWAGGANKNAPADRTVLQRTRTAATQPNGRRAAS